MQGQANYSAFLSEFYICKHDLYSAGFSALMASWKVKAELYSHFTGGKKKTNKQKPRSSSKFAPEKTLYNPGLEFPIHVTISYGLPDTVIAYPLSSHPPTAALLGASLTASPWMLEGAATRSVASRRLKITPPPTRHSAGLAGSAVIDPISDILHTGASLNPARPSMELYFSFFSAVSQFFFAFTQENVRTRDVYCLNITDVGYLHGHM